MKKGGSLSSEDLRYFLKASYKRKHIDYNNFQVDKHLTGQRVQVYHNPDTKHTVVVHRGTKGIHDAITDVRYALGDRSSQRFHHSAKVQRQAEAKYGAENITTVGHSIGGVLSESVGHQCKEVLTLNKPVSPADMVCRPVRSQQTDIRSRFDPVSVLRPFQRGKKATTLSSRSLNPLTEHSTDSLLVPPSGRLFGSGVKDGRCLYCL